VKSVTVTFQCNDQFGQFEGCARRVEVESVIGLDSVSLTRPPRLAFIEFDGLIRMIRISGRSFPVLKQRGHVGDPFHSAVLMESPVVAELLNFLKTKGAFLFDAGAIPASDPWHAETVRFTTRSLEEACAA
jgi:hypothetical protein